MPGTGLPSELPSEDDQICWLWNGGSKQLIKTQWWLKARFPRFSLNSSVGDRSEDVENLLDLESMIWSLGVNLTQPSLERYGTRSKFGTG